MKIKVKWMYDLCMVLLFVLMFNKRVISMSFHEVGGLILAAAILGHICINYRYVINVLKRLFSKQIPIKTRIGYFVNVALLVVFALIIVSGVFMSKVLFNVQGSNSWRTVHYTSSAVALILIGVHVGLHWGFIKGVFKKFIKIPQKVARPLAYIMMAAILLFGCFSMSTSSVGRWLTMPFTTPQNGMPGLNGERPFGDGKNLANNQNYDGSSNGERPSKGERPSRGEGQGRGQGYGDGKEMGVQQGQNIEIGTVLNVIATFFSIVSVFAILTYWIEKFFIRAKRKKKTMALTDNIMPQ